jgi:hypothetical protein
MLDVDIAHDAPAPMDVLASALGRCSKLNSLVIGGGYDASFCGNPSPKQLLDALVAPLLTTLHYAGDLRPFAWTNAYTTSISSLTLEHVALEPQALSLLTSLKTLELIACDTSGDSLPQGSSLARLTLRRVFGISSQELARLDMLEELAVSEQGAWHLLEGGLSNERLPQLTAWRQFPELENQNDDLEGLARHLKAICPRLRVLALQVLSADRATTTNCNKKF